MQLTNQHLADSTAQGEHEECTVCTVECQKAPLREATKIKSIVLDIVESESISRSVSQLVGY